MSDALQARRESILAQVKEFAEISLAPQQFVAGESVVPVSGKVLDADDMIALVDSSLEGWLTAGRFTTEFQDALADYVGTRSSSFVNSG